MKKTIIMIAMAITWCSASATGIHSAETPDTIKFIPRADNVTVVKTNGQTVIRAIVPAETGTGGEIYTYTISEESTEKYKGLTDMDSRSMLRLPFTNRSADKTKKEFKPSHYATALKYIYWGWNFNYNSKGGIKNCFEFSIADLIGIEWETSRHTNLGVGLGMSMTRATTADKQLFQNIGDRLDIVAAPEGADADYARLDTWRLQVPLYWRQRLTHQFGFSLGAIINFNTYSKAVNSYNIGKTRYKETIKGLNQRLLTVDLQATVGIVNGIGATVKWSPITSMQSIYGPSYRTISLGVTLNF